MKTENKGGVYIIQNKENWKVYVGSTTDLKERERVHFSMLRSGKHPCARLQEEFDEYSEDSFEFIVIADNLPGDLKYYEQNTIDVYDATNPEYGYNQYAAYIPPGKEILDELDATGLSINGLAEKHGWNDRAVINHLIEHMGVEAYNKRFGNPRRDDVPSGEELLQEIEDTGISIRGLARKYGCSVTTIKARLIDFMGLKAYTERFGNRRDDIPSGEELLREIEETGISIRGLARKYGCSVITIRKRLIDFMGLEAYNKRFGKPQRDDVPSGKELHEQKQRTGWSNKRLAEEHDCSEGLVWSRMDEHLKEIGER